MNTYWFGSVYLTVLGRRAQVFTETCLSCSLSVTYILGATQPGTLTTVLPTGDRVNHPWCSAGDVGGDVECLPSVVASVGCTVGGVGADRAI